MNAVRRDWRGCVIPPDMPFRIALEAMDKGARGVLVLEKEGRLVGLATDGDMRRWILKSGDLDAPMHQIATATPKTVNDTEQSSGYLKKFMQEHEIAVVPVVGKGSMLVSVVFWTDVFAPNEPRHAPIDAPVVVMAGGRGTRLDPLTRVLPKPLIPIGDKTIIERIIERFQEAGCNEYWITVGYKASLIKAFFSEANFASKISYVEETSPLGTAGALEFLKGKVTDPFFVTNCDVLVEADYGDAMRKHLAAGNAISVFAAMKHYRIPYGVLKASADGVLSQVEEKPGFDFLVNTGVYIINPAVLDLMAPDQHCHMTDLIARVNAAGCKVGIYPVSEKAWMDMGQMAELKLMVDRLNSEG